MSVGDVFDAVTEQHVVAIVRTKNQEEGFETARSLIAAGLRAIEVSLTTPGATEILRSLSGSIPAGVAIGAGTVLSLKDVDLAYGSGARYVVTPNFDETVVRAAARRGMIGIVGCGSVSEAVRASASGATFIKLFPASQWTPMAMSDVLAALPLLRFVPTGGVRVDDAATWIFAGAAAVGLGRSLSNLAADPPAIRLLLRVLEQAAAKGEL